MSNVEKLPMKPEPLVAGAPVKAIVPQTMEDAYRIATAVIEAGMAPQGLDTQAKCLIAIMQGLEVGLTPMASMQRIAVINGRATIWGDAAIGLVRASGLCEYVKEWITGEGDQMVAHCEAKRKGEKEPITGTFSVEDAKTAGLWGKKNRDGSPGMYQKYPKRMLQMRARGFVLRDGFADVLGGMYLREEVDDNEMRDVTPLVAPPAPSVEFEPQIEQEIIAPKPKGKRVRKPDPEPFDSAKWLEALEAELAMAGTEEILNEVWAQAQLVIEAGNVFPSDRENAELLYEKHMGRFG